MNATELPAREAMEFDVVVVGAGPAGLATAIRLKQLAPEKSVVVVEKGSEVGAHILSGAVIDPIGLDRLIPEWRGEEAPVHTAVSADRFYVLGSSAALRLPNFLLPRSTAAEPSPRPRSPTTSPIWPGRRQERRRRRSLRPD